MKNPLVTVVIPTKNSSKTLEATMRAVTGQTYKNIEIIVVDNMSTDGTREIAEKHGAKVFVVGPERCAQINHGVSKARGEYVYFTGSDLLPDSDYVEKAIGACENKDFDAIYTSVVSAGDNFWAKVKGMERRFYIGEDFFEAARFMKKSVFEAVGGIDENMVIVDETDLQQKLNKACFKTGRIDAVETHLGEAESLEEVFNKGYYYGKHIMKFVNKNKGTGVAFMFPFRYVFFKNAGTLLKNPAYSVGLVCFKAVQYSAAFLGILSAKINPTDAVDKK